MEFNKDNDPAKQREELVAIMPVYDQIRHNIAGEFVVKKQRETYLPKPNAGDLSDENAARYNEYLLRAVFYNVVGETNEGFQGQLQLKAPVITLPESLEPMRKNCDGQGLSMAQIIKDASQYIVPYGRGGWLTDFPARKKTVSRAEIASGEVLPTIRFIKPWNIVNWEERYVNHKKMVTMVVVREEMEERTKESLEIKRYQRYRVMLMTGANFDRCRLYLVTINKPSEIQKKSEFDNQGSYLVKEFACLDQAGEPLTKLPFEFIGAENNDSTIDIPPLYTMSVLNMGHYRNSADYEESVYMTGQPTPWASGLTEKWLNDVLGGQLRLGSRGLISMPTDGQVGLLQAAPNTLAYEAMRSKEEQMIAAGAKLTQAPSTVERKEVEVENEGAAQTSKLSKMATNLETSLVDILQTAYQFVSATPASDEELKVEINKIFNIGSRSPEQLRVLNELANSDNPSITRTEVRAYARLAGIAEQDDAIAFAEIDKLQADRAARAARAIALQPKQPPVGSKK